MDRGEIFLAALPAPAEQRKPQSFRLPSSSIPFFCSLGPSITPPEAERVAGILPAPLTALSAPWAGEQQLCISPLANCPVYVNVPCATFFVHPGWLIPAFLSSFQSSASPLHYPS